MQKLLLPILAMLIAFVGISCKKEMAHKKLVTLDVTVNAGTAYTLALQPYGSKKSKALITKQATTYVTSEIQSTPGNFNAVYHFLTNSKIVAKEKVVIKVWKKSCDDDDDDDDYTIITINFTIE